jgi:hypothetical protein
VALSSLADVSFVLLSPSLQAMSPEHSGGPGLDGSEEESGAIHYSIFETQIRLVSSEGHSKVYVSPSPR